MSNESPPLLTAELARSVLGTHPPERDTEMGAALRALASGKTECRTAQYISDLEQIAKLAGPIGGAAPADVEGLLRRADDLRTKATPGKWQAWRLGNSQLSDGSGTGQSELKPLERPYNSRWLGYENKETAEHRHRTAMLRDEDADYIVALYELHAALRGRVVGGQDVAGLLLAVYRICEHCNKEYQTPIDRPGKGYNFGPCPHCKVRDDVWVSVERAAPLHEQRLDVGRAQSQHDAESRVRPEAPVPLTEEPSIEQLSVAWTRAISLRGIAGAGTEALIALQQLRNRRCTWFGEDDNRLRVCLDKYLGEA